MNETRIVVVVVSCGSLFNGLPVLVGQLPPGMVALALVAIDAREPI